MTKIRCQVSGRREATLPENFIVNTVYFDDFNVAGDVGTDWQAFANDVRDAFNLRGGSVSGYGHEVKVYDMADAKPRPVRAVAPWQDAGLSGSEGPREVALCLSYFSVRNIPRFRGRIYVGPWDKQLMDVRPNAGVREAVVSLANRLEGIGGVDVDWGLWSPTRDGFSKITAGWVDDEWDTMRSRGLKSSARTTFKTAE